MLLFGFVTLNLDIEATRNMDVICLFSGSGRPVPTYTVKPFSNQKKRSRITVESVVSCESITNLIRAHKIVTAGFLYPIFKLIYSHLTLNFFHAIKTILEIKTQLNSISMN